MAQTIAGFPNNDLLAVGVDGCVIKASLKTNDVTGLGGATLPVAASNYNFDPVLGMTSITGSAKGIPYAISGGDQTLLVSNYTLSCSVDVGWYSQIPASTIQYLFSGSGGSAITHASLNPNGRQDYQEAGNSTATTIPAVYLYPEDKPAQVQEVISATPSTLSLYIDGLQIYKKIRTPNVAASWANFYFGGFTTLAGQGNGLYALKDVALQTRAIVTPPRKIRSVGLLGTSYFTLSSAPQQLNDPDNFVDWMPRGTGGGQNYAVSDTLTKVSSVIGSGAGAGTGGTITVASISPFGGVSTGVTASGGSGYIAGEIITAASTSGVGTGARMVITAVNATGGLLSAEASNPYGYSGGQNGGITYAATNVLTPSVVTGGGSGGTIVVSTVNGAGNVLTATASGGSSYVVGSIIAAVTGGAGTGAQFVVTGVSAGAMTGVIPRTVSGIVSGGGYQMNPDAPSAANPANYNARGDTSVICQIFRQLAKAGEFPVQNSLRSESGCTLTSLIGTAAATGRSYLTGFEAMKAADGVYPELVIINAGTNEVAENSGFPTGGTNYDAFDANYKTLLTNLSSAGVSYVVLQEVLSLANNPTYSAGNYPARVVALNTIINALPAWCVSQGMAMKVAVDPVYAKFGGASPTAGLFRTTDIHPNAIGSSLLGYSAGQTATNLIRSGGSSSGGTLDTALSSIL